MRHLSHVELLDLAEDPAGAALAVDRRRHVEACEACRAGAAALRATLTEAQLDTGSDPSPLFWTHFAERVSEAICDESPAAAAGHSRLWFGGRAAAWSAAALVLVLGLTTVAWRATLHAPASTTRAATAEPAEAGERAAGAEEQLDADQAWGVVQAAADGLKWDDAQAAGISARPGSAERVAMELTPDERTELARLLETEMKRSGA